MQRSVYEAEAKPSQKGSQASAEGIIISGRTLVRILIAPLSIPESQPKPKHHNSDRR
jgi:hypothetical protein